MFESEGGEGRVNLGRRLFLSGVGAALGGVALVSLRRPHVTEIGRASCRERV